MSENLDNKYKANELRKSGDLKAALPLYKDLWETTQDKFAAAGLIFCYRKQRKFDEALEVAEDAYSKFSDFDWCRNEYIWTLIQGKLFPFTEDDNLSEILETVDKILEAKPDDIAFRITIFKLLKHAKKRGKWDILNEWITKLNPKDLDGYEEDTTGWTDRELWYYYRVCGLALSNKEDEAIELINANEGEFFKKKKFFERLKAKAFIRLGKIDEASQIYENLVTSRADWWLLHEYGKFLLDQKEEKKALSHFVNAALSPPMKLELKVTLLSDIANLLIELDKKEQALPHLLLTKAVREKEGWGIVGLDERIENLGGNAEENLRIDSLLKKCQEIWQDLSGRKIAQNNNNTTKKNLIGKVINLDDGRPFCFIKTRDNQSYFCFKSDLPKGIVDGQIVNFDLIPSFDKKKNQESVKAVSISIHK